MVTGNLLLILELLDDALGHGVPQLFVPATMKALIEEDGLRGRAARRRGAGRHAAGDGRGGVAQGRAALQEVPHQTAHAAFQVSAGKAKYDPIRGALFRKLKRFNGGADHTLVASVELIATARERRPWGRPPLALSLTLPTFSASGVRVQYLKVWEKSWYTVDKWVRKLTKSGDCQTRM